jgi:hypothetical protein
MEPPLPKTGFLPVPAIVSILFVWSLLTVAGTEEHPAAC